MDEEKVVYSSLWGPVYATHALIGLLRYVRHSNSFPHRSGSDGQDSERTTIRFNCFWEDVTPPLLFWRPNENFSDYVGNDPHIDLVKRYLPTSEFIVFDPMKL